MRQDQLPTNSSVHGETKPLTWQAVARRPVERFILGSLIGLALALVISGAANIALYRDAQCRRFNRQARWGTEFSTCFSQVAHWEVSAVARGPAAAADDEGGSLLSWLSIPLAYALLGGLVGQLPLRRALLGGLILQILIVGVLALMGFFAVYVG